jgi:hypothetical protein
MDEELRQALDATISDSVARFLYYDRKEDETLDGPKMDELMGDEDTVAWVIGRFAHHLLKGTP